MSSIKFSGNTGLICASGDLSSFHKLVYSIELSQAALLNNRKLEITNGAMIAKTIESMKGEKTNLFVSQDSQGKVSFSGQGFDDHFLNTSADDMILKAAKIYAVSKNPDLFSDDDTLRHKCQSNDS